MIEVDISAALKIRPRPHDLGRLLSPTQATANSFSKEFAEAQSASRPYSPYFARYLRRLPWRIDTPSRARPCEDGKSRRRRFAQASPPPNTAQMIRYRSRYLIAGQLADAWAKLAGSEARVRHLPTRLEACTENNIDVTAWPGARTQNVISRRTPSLAGWVLRKFV